jgi:hypothetical protein
VSSRSGFGREDRTVCSDPASPRTTAAPTPDVGDGPARVLGFFGASTNVAHFSEELAPGVRTLVVGAETGVALPVPEPAVA